MTRATMWRSWLVVVECQAAVRALSTILALVVLTAGTRPPMHCDAIQSYSV